MSTTNDPAERAGAWLAVLIPGILGAFAFIGLEDEVVSVVLRNSPSYEPKVTGALILIAILLSVSSAFAIGQQVRLDVAIAALTGALALLVGTGVLIEGPSDTTKTTVASVLVAGGLLLLAVVLAVAARSRAGPHRRVPLQAMLLMLSAIFVVAAVQTGLDLQTRVQATITSPQLDAIVSQSGDRSIEVNVSASKLTNGSFVETVIYGSTAQLFPPDGGRACRSSEGCEVISAIELAPDEFGRVEGAFAVPIADRIEVVSIIAKVCEDSSCPAWAEAQRKAEADIWLPGS